MQHGGDVGPVAKSKRVRLRPIEVKDYPQLYTLAVDPETNFRWRFRGNTPSPQEFERALWEGVLAQFALVSISTERLCGFVVSYTADMRNRSAHIAVNLMPDFRFAAWPLEGLVLFVDYLFRLYDFRKLYAEVLGFNFHAIASGLDEYFVEEGRLRQHEFHDGQYWDLHILAIWRGTWERRSPAVMDWLSSQ